MDEQLLEAFIIVKILAQIPISPLLLSELVVSKDSQFPKEAEES